MMQIRIDFSQTKLNTISECRTIGFGMRETSELRRNLRKKRQKQFLRRAQMNRAAMLMCSKTNRVTISDNAKKHHYQLQSVI